MKRVLSKTGAQQAVDAFFQKETFAPDEVRKIRRIAMKYNIKLGAYRKRFCKKCLSPLRGKLRFTKTHKSVVCEKCNTVNKIRLS